MLKKYLLSELIFLPLKKFIAHLAALWEKSQSWHGIRKQASLHFPLSGRTSLRGSPLPYSYHFWHLPFWRRPICTRISVWPSDHASSLLLIRSPVFFSVSPMPWWWWLFLHWNKNFFLLKNYLLSVSGPYKMLTFLYSVLPLHHIIASTEVETNELFLFYIVPSSAHYLKIELYTKIATI